MKRVLIACCFFIVFSTGAFSQQNVAHNPFKKLAFLNGPTDTITLVSSYSTIKKSLDVVNKALVETIKQNTGKQIKGLNYTIDLKLDNYTQITVACSDVEMLNILIGNAGKNQKVLVKCIVYRFYSFDGICNFFYVDKVNLVDNPEFITKNI